MPVYAEEQRDGQTVLYVLCDVTTPEVEYVTRTFLVYNTAFGQDGVAVEDLRYICPISGNPTSIVKFVCEILPIAKNPNA